MDSASRDFFAQVRSRAYAQLIFEGVSAGQLMDVLMGASGYRLTEPSAITAQSAVSVFQCFEAFALFDGLKLSITDPLVALLKAGGREKIMQVLDYIHRSALIQSKRKLLVDVDVDKIVAEFNLRYHCKDYWPESAVNKVNSLLGSVAILPLRL